MKFKEFATVEGSSRWEQAISRIYPIYTRSEDVRSPFNRDYTRVIHSTAYRRLKHKTQVFFSPTSDHICTRIEHVNLVESISYTIASTLGLNTELTKVISVAHDLGHAPFGHHGERVLSGICKKHLKRDFWHEQNGLVFVDYLENLTDDDGNPRPLNLTYAVRDGIISHCGEVMENGLIPREQAVPLNEIKRKNLYMPYTFEGCVVKMSDTISYIGRDIEDALKTNILSISDLNELSRLINGSAQKNLNNGDIINRLITDLCLYSTPEEGLRFSQRTFEFLSRIKSFNIKNIYNNPRMKPSNDYTALVLNTIFDTLYQTVSKNYGQATLTQLSKYYPRLTVKFNDYIKHYLSVQSDFDRKNLSEEEQYICGIIYYICGMTDNFALEIFDEIVRF